MAYAAPEQLVGRPVDGRTDQYALAATAYHLLTGACLYPHSNPAVVIGQHLTAQPPSLANSHSDLAALDPVLSKALAKDPKDRFGSCTEFARTLANATATPPTYSTFPPRDAAPAPKRWPSLLAAVALVVAVCVAGYVVIKVINRSAASPQQFALTGTIHLNGDNATTSGLPAGYRCAGDQDLGDVAPDASVTVADEAGKLLAKGSFESSYLVGGSCNMSFRIDNVPSGANFYRVKVAHQSEESFTEPEAKAGVDITLGSSQPSSSPTVTAAPSSTRPSTTSSAVPDPEQQALNRLRAIAADDKPAIIAYLNDRWVPQLSSKYKDLEAEGTVWTYAKILQEHLALRQRYPGVKLLWSSDWPVFEPGFWVTVAGVYYEDYGGALAWCTYQGFDRNHCFAKLISTTHGPNGSTQLNP